VIVPLGTDRPLHRPSVVTLSLIIANIAVYAVDKSLTQVDPSRRDVIDRLILDPRSFHIWALVTYAFLHANFYHIAGNLLTLWVFGPNVEDRFGRLGFLVFYLAGGAAAGGFHCIFERSPVLGASGAIAAVTGAYLVLFPRTQIKALFLLILGIIQIPAWWFIGARIAWDIWSTGSGHSGNVATGAHLAGYTFGATISMFLLWTRILPREVYDLFSISKQAARRRQFREAHYQQQKAAQAKTAAASTQQIASEPLAKARAEVSDRLSHNDSPGACSAYKRLLTDFGTPSAMLSRKSQYDIANLLLREGDHQTAATAYTLFLQGYPNDPEVPLVRLMLGLINTRYLNNPVQAKQDVAAAMEGLPDGNEKELAKELMTELG
jgi:membrane associated rhomboid family serine protease